MAFPYYPHVPGTGVPCGPCGSPGNQFPYTVQHDANLNYICETVAKAMQEQLKTNEAFTALDADFGELVEYVNKWMDDQDVPGVVAKWLNDYVASGRFEALVRDNIKKYGYFFQDAGFTQYPWQPDVGYAMCEVIFLWLWSLANPTCIKVKGNDPGWVYLASYSQTKTYRDFTSNERTFVGTDTAQDENGVTMPVVYLDCSSFVNLITRSIKPGRSLNQWVALGNPTSIDNISDQPCLSKILEDPSVPWTFDFIGRANTYSMAKLMDCSGNALTRVARGNGTRIDYYEPVANLSTGDILFLGKDSDESRYRGIHHCGIFIKNLNVLRYQGYEFKTYNDEVSDRGYIVECTGNPASTKRYKNVLRIVTLENWMVTRTEQESIYAAKPRTNWMLSNKARSRGTMEILCKDRTYYINKHDEVIGQKNNATLDEYFGNVRVKGLTIPSTGMDIDVVGYGTWQATLHDTINACTGHWPNGWTMSSAESIVIQQTGGAASGYGRLQILWANFGASDTRMAFRMRTPGSAWSEWAIVMTE